MKQEIIDKHGQADQNWGKPKLQFVKETVFATNASRLGPWERKRAKQGQPALVPQPPRPLHSSPGLPCKVLLVSVKLHFNSPADTICHTHGLDLVCDLGHFKNIVHWVLITVTEET